MPPVKKIIKKMKNQPNVITPSESDKVLRHYGYVLKRQKGSHAQYVNETTGDLTTIKKRLL